MTEKTAEKPGRAQKPQTPPTNEQLKAAFECHTLAQILFRQLMPAGAPPVTQTPLTPFTQPAVGTGATPWQPTWQGEPMQW